MREYRVEYDIVKGLRPLNKSVRDAQFLSYATGIFSEEGTLKTVEEGLEFTHSIVAEFPYPQVFCLAAFTLVCLPTSIMEYKDGIFTSVLTGLTECYPWSVADFHDYLYLTNGVHVVIRDSTTQTYAIDSTKYEGSCCLNLNGQLIVGGIQEIKYEQV